MATQINIAEAKARLSELVAASLRGEDIILARAGVPMARIVPIAEASVAVKRALGEKRRAAFGKYRKEFEGVDLSIERFQNLYPDYGRKFDDL